MDRDASPEDFPDSSTPLILDNLPQLVAILDADLRYRFGNEAHRAWFGVDPATLAGRHIREVVGAEAFALLADHCGKALESGATSYVGHVPFARGGTRHVHCTAVSRTAADGAIDGLLIVAADLTQHRLLRQALDHSMLQIRNILETAVDGIVTIDAQGVIQSFNPAAERQFGYSAAEVIGRHISILMPAPHAEAHDGYLQSYLQTGERHIIGIGREVTARRKDGTELPIELAVGEFIEDGRHYFTGFTRDISERREVERIARNRLDELAEVTRRSSMNDFATGFAHEISQPLTAIVTMAQTQLRLLRSGRDTPGALEHTLELIAQQGMRSSGIIEQMRDFVRREKKVRPSLLRPDAIIRDALKLLDHELHRNRIRVRCECHDGPESILVNRVQIEQVLFNVVQNAVLAMQDVRGERTLTVRVRVSGDSNKSVEFTVSDTGHGLPEDSSRIFEPFFTTRAHGMGQGLSISRSIVEAHGGSIRALRNDGPGATIVFTLPAATEEEN